MKKMPLPLTVAFFAGVALAAPAQSDSSASFGGDPDSFAFIRIPSDTPDWTTHFRIGALVGMNISANFSIKGQFNISGNNPAQGIFDDGYVHPDQSGDANYTSYWGYQNASQYDSVAQTLTLHSSSSYSTTGGAKDDGGPFPGFDMAYGDNLWYWKHARVGWELGFGLLPISIKDNSSLTATVNQSAYIYDVSNPLGAPLPEAPYQGGATSIGHLIPTTYSSVSSQTLLNQTVTGTRQLDVMLYTVRFGPSFYWDLNDYVGMSLAAGPALGIVSGKYEYNETIAASGVNAVNSGHFGTTGLTFGGYVNGTVLYHILNDADLYLSAQYMPMGNASFSSGGREAQLNLGGQIYVSVGVNWPF